VHDFEIAFLSYVVVGALSSLVFWLLQRGGRNRGERAEVESSVSVLGVMIIAGLAWPISLPLTAYGWLKEIRSARRSGR
jgi:hypothetical protein